MYIVKPAILDYFQRSIDAFWTAWEREQHLEEFPVSANRKTTRDRRNGRTKRGRPPLSAGAITSASTERRWLDQRKVDVT